MINKRKPVKLYPYDKCSKCNCLAVRLVGRAKLCPEHCRTARMRHTAKARGLSVPSPKLLAALVVVTKWHGMRCPCCGIRMKWMSEGGSRSNVVSLQHDRDGGFRLICVTCNNCHRNYPGDSFYDLPAGHKRCGHCGKVKAYQEFGRNKRRLNGINNYCKTCVSLWNAKRPRRPKC